MTVLLIDSGNTRIKWASSDGSELHFLGQDALSESLLRGILKKEYDTVWLSNVAGAEVENQIAALLLPHQQYHVVKSEKKSFLGVVNGYRVPEQLGVDRWLAMQAAWHRYGTACCVVSCGTAITLDVLNETGEHQGGVIFPGLRMMQRSLFMETAALPNMTMDEFSDELSLANNTEDGIMRGVLGGVLAFIEKNISESKVKHSVLTGGDANTISAQLVCRVDVDVNLVLQGLMLYSMR